MGHTFTVDEDLAPPDAPCPTRRWADLAGPALALGGDPELQVVETGRHALLGAVHRAFAEHRPLVLSPDAMWLTIAQGVAQHVRLHAEALRPRLVRHAGKQKLKIVRAAMPSDAGAWGAVIAEFRELLADHIGDGRARLLECDFSTTGDVERTASRVVLMDAFAPYFTYEMTCICGIPSITLTGTVDDWRRLRAKIDVIAELDLEKWHRSLAPMADQWIAAASGKPSVRFWRWIYKPRAAYGGDSVTGWIGRLYPYLEGEGKLDWPNPLLDLPLVAPQDASAGVSIRSFSSVTSSVDLDVVDEAGARSTILLEAGVLAVAQDADGRLVPTAGWIARPGVPRIDDVVARIEAEADEVEPPDGRATGPAELIAIFDRIGGALIHGWRLGSGRHQEFGDHWVTPVLRRADGRFIAHCSWWGDTLYASGRTGDPSLAYLGTSLGAVLTWLLDHPDGASPPSTRTLGDQIAEIKARAGLVDD